MNSGDVHCDRDRSSLLNSMHLRDLEIERERIHIELCNIFPEGEDLSLQVTVPEEDTLPPSLSQTQNTLWGNLIKEACWLANDFQKEHVRHIGNAKKISKAVEQYHKTKEVKKIKKQKDEVQVMKRIAGKLSREVRKFWLKINKVVAFKQKSESDELRQKAMDKHLVFLVKQTERYTQMLADNMQSNVAEEGNLNDPAEVSRSNLSAPSQSKKRKHREASSSSSTAAAAGRKAAATSTPREQRVAFDLPLPRRQQSDGKPPRKVLKVNLAGATDLSRPGVHGANAGGGEEGEGDGDGDDYGDSDGDEDEEFVAGVDEEDDETALIEQELLECQDYESEVRRLKAEGDMPLEELVALYQGAGSAEASSTIRGSGPGSGSGSGPGQRDRTDGSRYPDSEEEEEEEEEEDDGEFEPDDDDVNAEEDEARWMEQEEVDHAEVAAREQELEALQVEGQMPIDALRALYAAAAGEGQQSFHDPDPDIDPDQGDDGSCSSSSSSGASGEDEEEEEECSAAESSPDDEASLLEQERMDRLASGNDPRQELDALRADCELSVEQLRAMYCGGGGPSESQGTGDGSASHSEEDDDGEDGGSDSGSGSGGSEEEEDGEFAPSEDSADMKDEAEAEAELVEQEAFEAQGGGGGSHSYAEELDLLRRESELSIDELRDSYGLLGSSSSRHAGDAASLGSDDDGHGHMEEEEGEEDAAAANQASAGDQTQDMDVDVDAAFRRLEAADLAARSIAVDRPFTLAPSLVLREYQQAGLNWLVSLQERRLNGILADEMGLGKTVQTISLLAYLAVSKGIWGPHLIVVPTSCIVNWETELKRFCPIFKVLTYFGSSKARKILRTGWSRANSFHICITSYQLVVQDSSAFRRKRWYYMILDEAHNIKNFKSRRWQTLLNFNTQRRLLLTGTPLQNNLMELWSLMHFLMPHIFRSRKEFSYWFSNPLAGMVEGSRSVNGELIARLHGIMRPFLLRRLKRDVEKQLPGKFEHIVTCRLSKRQLHLYEEFMSRSATRASLAGGNFLGMMNILMQLRKVCNHPDLFEARPIASPFIFEGFEYRIPALIPAAMDRPVLGAVSALYVSDLWRGRTHDSLAVQAAARLAVRSECQFVAIDDQALDSSHCHCSPHLRKAAKYLTYIQALAQHVRTERLARAHFNFAVSDRRCSLAHGGSTFVTDWRRVRLLTVPAALTQAVLAGKGDCYLLRNIPAALASSVLSVEERAAAMDQVVAHFVFVLPKIVSAGPLLVAGAGYAAKEARISPGAGAGCSAELSRVLAPFYGSRIRQTIFFPDKKLVQFDSGKLQTLAVLLAKLKRDGHKCLIFTQMSKMLDILEVFMNLHSHSFVRLDGSTGIERRQKLMDRFNSDARLFCFILSTRSGGLGINLTGADTVIFYDTDWNPAMDAQAQDRAHRIGQTRDVHIYRLICGSTVEENILMKARQKRHLDFLVMTEGNFSETSLFTASGLKDVLGVADLPQDGAGPGQGPGPDSVLDVEAAMLAAEDEDDVAAMRVTKEEMAKELDEFDEDAPIEQLDEGGGGGGEHHLLDQSRAAAKAARKAPPPPPPPSSSGLREGDPPGATGLGVEVEEADQDARDERDMEREFASWQEKVGPDFRALQSALKPVERYALRFRTDCDPYYSLFYISEQARLDAMREEALVSDQWDVEEIERDKEEEEYRALNEGELVAANISRRPEEAAELKCWYLAERRRRQREKQRRAVTGAGWGLYLENGVPYWYNSDTGEASYRTPKIIAEQEKFATALERGYNAMPSNVMLHILAYLRPLPDRIRFSEVCARWNEAVRDDCFKKFVLPVESGVRDAGPGKGVRLSANTFACIRDALESALPGDVIVLSDGHYWEDTLRVKVAVRIIHERFNVSVTGSGSNGSGGGDGEACSKCVVEMLGPLIIEQAAGCVVLAGISIRRPRRIAGAHSLIHLDAGNLSIYRCVVNNDGAGGCALFATNRSVVTVHNSFLKGGERGSGILAIGSDLYLAHSSVTGNDRSGIFSVDGAVYCSDCYISRNTNHAISVVDTSLLHAWPAVVALVHCDLADNRDGIVRYLVLRPFPESLEASSLLDDGFVTHRDGPVYSLNSIGDWESPLIHSSDEVIHSGRRLADSPLSAYANRQLKKQQRELELYSWPNLFK